MSNFQTYLSLDTAALQRRIQNEEFALSKFQLHADLINKILDHIDNGTIDEYCQEWSQTIKDCNVRIQTMKLAMTAKGLQ